MRDKGKIFRCLEQRDGRKGINWFLPKALSAVFMEEQCMRGSSNPILGDVSTQTDQHYHSFGMGM